jgi:hypothetical protein
MAEFVVFSFVVAGEKQFVNKLPQIGAATSDNTEAWEAMAGAFYEIEKDRFSHEGANDGLTKWHPLTPKYEDWKQKHSTGKILNFSGDLELSLTRPDAEGSICHVYPRGLEIGTGLRDKSGKWNLGMLFQMGTRFSAPREPIRINDKSGRKMSKALAKVMRKEILKATGRA